MVVGDSMGPRLQLVRARFLNFLLGKLSREFKLRRMSIFHEIQTTLQSDGSWLGMLVVLQVLCMLI